MARLPYVDKEDLAEKDRDLLARPINLYRELANSPDALRHFRFGHWIRHGSTVDARLREMAILQVGYVVARAAYEWSHHIKIGRDFGVSDADIRALIDETAGRQSGLSPLDRAVLSGAREMTADLRIADDTFVTLREGLGEDALIQLIMVIAHYNAIVRLLATLEIDIEPDYRTHLDEFPLPA